jgi:TPR repeat protein
LRKAADAGHALAMTNLGAVLHDAAQDDEAEVWLRKAADTGNADHIQEFKDFLREMGRTS